MKLEPQHPTLAGKTIPVEADLDAILHDNPGTKLHGLELQPFDETIGKHTTEEQWGRMPQTEKDRWISLRKHDLWLGGIDKYLKTPPSELWKHYKDPGKRMYAPDVPHVAVETPSGIIHPKYLKIGACQTPR